MLLRHLPLAFTIVLWFMFRIWLCRYFRSFLPLFQRKPATYDMPQCACNYHRKITQHRNVRGIEKFRCGDEGMENGKRGMQFMSMTKRNSSGTAKNSGILLLKWAQKYSEQKNILSTITSAKRKIQMFSWRKFSSSIFCISFFFGLQVPDLQVASCSWSIPHFDAHPADNWIRKQRSYKGVNCATWQVARLEHNSLKWQNGKWYSQLDLLMLLLYLWQTDRQSDRRTDNLNFIPHTMSTIEAWIAENLILWLLNTHSFIISDFAEN